MQESLTALFATAIYQAQSALADPDAVDQTIELLAHAVAGTAVSFEVGETDLVVNGAPLPPPAPGVELVRRVLVDHHTMRLRLPPGTTGAQWRTVVEIYSSAPGLYESVDDLRDAMRAGVPDVMVGGSRGRAAEADLRSALFELPGLRATSSVLEPARLIDPHDAEIAHLEARLDPLLQSAAHARQAQDHEELATVLLQIRQLEEAGDDDLRAIVARERRRVVPFELLEGMARSIAKPATPAVVGRALGAMGNDGATALINALTGATGPHERRAYIEALVACRDCEDAIVMALGNSRLELSRDAAEIAGRRRIERAVPMLTHMLKHPRGDVRTAAWRALEMIGTPAAMKAFRT
jgi:hypothetical protein